MGVPCSRSGALPDRLLENVPSDTRRVPLCLNTRAEVLYRVRELRIPIRVVDGEGPRALEGVLICAELDRDDKAHRPCQIGQTR